MRPATPPYAPLPPDDARAVLAFAEANPQCLSPAQARLKLALFGFTAPLLPPEQDSDILEIGCGQGLHSALLSRHGRVTAVELADTQGWMGGELDVRRATVLAALGQGPIRFRTNPPGRLDFPDASFDVVFHNSVIEHVPNPAAFNAEALRVLRPGGLALCITGTRALCALRLVRGHLMRLPLTLAAALAVELAPQRLAALSGRRLARRPEAALEALSLPRQGAAAPGDPLRLGSRLVHVLAEPRYNQSLLERLAAENGTDPGALLRGAARALASRPLALALRLAAPTHGQHYPGALAEYRAWALDRWRETFTRAGFSVEAVHGCRAHHLFEWGLTADQSARMALAGAPLVPRLHALGLPVGLYASEFLLAGRKPG